MSSASRSSRSSFVVARARLVDRYEGVRVGDQLAELVLLVVADRRLEGDRLLCRPVKAATISTLIPISSAISAGVGLRPSAWLRRAVERLSLLRLSTTCTGTRIVRDLSAMPRAIAWRIHHVA